MCQARAIIPNNTKAKQLGAMGNPLTMGVNKALGGGELSVNGNGNGGILGGFSAGSGRNTGTGNKLSSGGNNNRDRLPRDGKWIP